MSKFLVKDLLRQFAIVGEIDMDTLVSTDGGRYDVNIMQRTRTPIYWEAKTTSTVRRSTWFYKDIRESRFTPYEERHAAKLEVGS